VLLAWEVDDITERGSESKRRGHPPTFQCELALHHNPIYHQRAKHVDVARYIVRELVARGEMKVKSCPTEDMLADSVYQGTSKAQVRREMQGNRAS
jgi:hypothetical protein